MNGRLLKAEERLEKGTRKKLEKKSMDMRERVKLSHGKLGQRQSERKRARGGCRPENWVKERLRI